MVNLTMSTMIPTQTEVEAPTPASTENGSNDWRSLFLEELERASVAGRWGLAFQISGWVHLAFFAVCQWIYTPGARGDLRYLALWVAEVVALLVIFRRVSGPGWWKIPRAAGLLVRIWGTFLILTFNVASYNSLMGWEMDWFKPVWATLGTFGFATLAWLIDLRFLVFAFGMYFTGLLLIQFPHGAYAIYGVVWWLVLQVIGVSLERHRRRSSAGV